MNKKGSFLVELLIAISLFTSLTMITSAYFLKFLKEKKKIEVYIKNQNIDELMEHFFEDENNCTESLKGLSHTDSLLELKLQSKPSQTVEFYQDLLNSQKIKKVRVLIEPLKNQYGLATVNYETEKLDSNTKAVSGFIQRDLPVFVSLDEDNSILACHINGLVTNQCKGDYKNVIFYNESGLVPVLYNLVEEAQKHGTEYKTTMSQIYNEATDTGVQCQSHLYCDSGEWVSSVSCYNSCQDTVWSLGDDKFQSINNKKCQPGEIAVQLGSGQMICKKNQNSRKKWCSSQFVSVPYQFDLGDYCSKITSTANWQNTYSSHIANICNGSKRWGQNTGGLTLPSASFGKIVKVSKPIKIKKLKGAPLADMEIGQVSLYARCEYTGFFSLLGLTEDVHSNITLSGDFENQKGRKKTTQVIGAVSQNICSAEYITKNVSQNQKYLCGVNQKVKMCHPENPGFCPEERRISDLYSTRPPAFNTHIPQGLPIRFFYSYSENDPAKSFSAFYTAMCDKRNFCGTGCLPEKSSGSNFRMIKAQSHCGGEQPQLDLIFVVDSSGSMGDDQAKLHNNLGVFLDQFLTPDLNLDYNIAVLDTEKNNTLFGGNYLCRDCNSPRGQKENIGTTRAILKERMKTGTYGGKEYSLRRVIDLQRWDSLFFRKNASLAIFFLTDEEDQDYENGRTSIVSQFISFLENTLNKDMKKVLIYLGSYLGSSTCSLESQAGLDLMYNRAGAKGAYTGKLDLCDPDWTDELRDFGQQIRNSLLQNTPLNSNYDFSKVDKKGLYKNLKCN